MVHKPACATPLSALRFARVICEAAGAPKGAYNVVTGPGALIGDVLVDTPHVAMITFTGSAEVGLAHPARAGLKRVTLELGSNSAVMIEPDADLDDRRRPRRDRQLRPLRPGLHLRAAHLRPRIRSPTISSNASSPPPPSCASAIRSTRPPTSASLITEEEAVRVEAWIRRRSRPAPRLLTGGGRKRATIEPTVLADVARELRISCKEAFGPVVVRQPLHHAR